MPRQSKPPFISRVLEQLAELDSLTYRPMFGCYGLYDRGVFFAIVSGEDLFFRTDEQSRKQYVKRGMEPFVFREQQKSNNYYRVPDQIFDNPKLLKKWAETAICAQQNAKKKKNRESGKRTATSRKSEM